MTGSDNIASGVNSGNGVVGSDNIAMGTGAGNGGVKDNAVAIGTNTWAGTDSVAVGNGATANGQSDTAMGDGATVLPGNNHSTALGAGAVADENNLFVMGTTQDTYRAPGITSGLSLARQHGPLEVVTSDANGNLATDGGSIFGSIDRLNRRSDQAFAGTALALAANGPDLTGHERFGISASYGNFEGASAFGMGFEGVLGYDVLTRGDRIALTGGWGVGFPDGGDDVFGGRVGGQWTWGAAPHPYILK